MTDGNYRVNRNDRRPRSYDRPRAYAPQSKSASELRSARQQNRIVEHIADYKDDYSGQFSSRSSKQASSTQREDSQRNRRRASSERPSVSSRERSSRQDSSSRTSSSRRPASEESRRPSTNRDGYRSSRPASGDRRTASGTSRSSRNGTRTGAPTREEGRSRDRTSEPERRNRPAQGRPSATRRPTSSSRQGTRTAPEASSSIPATILNAVKDFFVKLLAFIVSIKDRFGKKEAPDQSGEESLLDEPLQVRGASQENDKQLERRKRAREAEFADIATHEDPEYEPRQASSLQSIRNIAVLTTVGILVVGGVIGCLLFARPSVSMAEKRELTQFPELTAQSFADGSFFTNVSLWYSDTYPLREPLVNASLVLSKLKGVSSSEMLYGGSVVADDIPDAPEPPSKDSPDDAKSTTTENKDLPEVLARWNKMIRGQNAKGNPADLLAEPPENGIRAEDVESQILEGLYVQDDACYSIYYFDKEAVTSYTAAINLAADNLKGTSQVYSIVVPNSTSILLSEDTIAKLGGSDETKAINYFYSLYDEDVQAIESTRILKEHKDEYLFFKTDHHWTADGAYYIYQNFCALKGFDAASLDSFETKEFPGFQGSFSSTLKSASIPDSSDIVHAYIPKSTNDMTYTDGGTTTDWKIIQDVSDWDSASKYNCFIGGDHPLSHIANPEKTDGSSCLVIKDSFGDCLVPFLVDHYQDVWVIDYRYSENNIIQFAKENSIDDVIFLNNTSIAGTLTTAGQLASLVKE